MIGIAWESAETRTGRKTHAVLDGDGTTTVCGSTVALVDVNLPGVSAPPSCAHCRRALRRRLAELMDWIYWPANETIQPPRTPSATKGTP